MTKELQETLDKEIDEAIASNDDARIRRCTARYVKAIGDCQKKSSDRIKTIVQSVNAIETSIGPMKESHKQFQEMLVEKKAVIKIFKWLKWLLAGIIGVIGWEGLHQIIDIMSKVGS